MSAGVIFDFDGVLVDSEALHHQAYNAVLAEWGIEVAAADYARDWIATGTGPEHAVAAYGLPISPVELRARKGPIYNTLLRDQARLMPGVETVVPALAARYPLAVATNSPEADVGFLLDRFDLRRHFRAVVTREQYARPKPAPDAFLAAATALGLPAARCLVVEDAWKGVAAAEAGGFPCVVVPHALTAEEDFGTATRVLAGLGELTPELVGLLTQPEATRPARHESKR